MTNIQLKIEKLNTKDCESFKRLESSILSVGLESTFEQDTHKEFVKYVCIERFLNRDTLFKYLANLDRAYLIKQSLLSHMSNQNTITVTQEQITEDEVVIEKIKKLISSRKPDSGLVTEDMNKKPWKYATHCLRSAPYNGSIFISNKNNTLLSYINGEWQPSDVYKGILQEIEIECHPEINEECNLIDRKDIKRYQEILDTKGVKELNKIYTDLCNSNSIGAIPNIVAIQVVLFNNDIELK